MRLTNLALIHAGKNIRVVVAHQSQRIVGDELLRRFDMLADPSVPAIGLADARQKSNPVLHLIAAKQKSPLDCGAEAGHPDAQINPERKKLRIFRGRLR